MRIQLAVKVSDECYKNNVAPSAKEVKSDVDYFAVVKTTIDNTIANIRVVYNVTSCLLNEAVLASSFMLPTADTSVRQVSFDYHQVNLDMRAMFLNFQMPASLTSVFEWNPVGQ